MADWDTIRARLEHGTYTGWLANDIRAALQRIEELERALKSADESITRNRLDRDRWRERAEAAEAKLARCVEALGEIRGRSLAAKTHEVGPLEAKGRLTRILELACAALAAAKGE